MRISRLVATAVTAGAVGLGTVALSAPAQAATAQQARATLATTTTLSVGDSDGLVEYGEDTYLTGAVKDSAGSSVYYGTVTLYAYSAKSPVWTPVATDTAGGYVSFDVTPDSNSQYKLVYSGGASSINAYTASESAVAGLSVQRKVKVSIKSAQLTLKMKVTPDFGKKKITVQIKKNGKYKNLKKVKTKANGKAKVKLPGKDGGGKLYFRIIVPGDASFVGWQGDYYTTVY